MITVWVSGSPKTKGSMEWQQGGGNRRGRAVQSVEGSEEWAWAVQTGVSPALVIDPATPLRGPVFVRATFWLPVPDVTVQRTGDLDKLLRNVLDAMTKAGAYGDDVQVTRSEVAKYATDGPNDPAGVLLEFEPDTRREDSITHLDDLTLRWHAMRQQGLA